MDDDAKFCSNCGAPAPAAAPEKFGTESPAFKTVKRDAGPYGAYRLEDLPEGFVIDDRYEVKAKVGQGGFGAVYRAYDRKMDVDKALKIIPDSVAADKEAMTDLQKEARIMISLTHETIVRVYDFQDRGSIKYIDMEYIDGRPLNELKLEYSDKKIPEERVKELAMKIATGLAYAHKKNVIHKDIKPQNVIVTDEGQVKIMDFGISESVRTSMSRLANSSSSGTLVYMAPEQVKGEDVGPEADIYSFGAMLYELLSGHPPFWKGAIEYQIFNEKPKPLEGVSDEMNDLVLKCLEKDYHDRYNNFMDILSVLNGEVRYSKHVHHLSKKPDTHFYIDKILNLSLTEDSLLVELEAIVEKIIRKNFVKDAFQSLEEELDENPGSIVILASLSLLHRNIGNIDSEYKILLKMISNEEKGVRMPEVFSFFKKRLIAIADMKQKYNESKKTKDEYFLTLLDEAEKDELLDWNVIREGKKEVMQGIIDEALYEKRWVDALYILEDEQRKIYLDKKYVSDKKTLVEKMKAEEEAEQKALEKKKRILVKKRGLVLIEGGTFTMGSKEDPPPHKVTLSAFYISKYTVTQNLYTEIMGKNPSDKKASDIPVNRIGWFEAIDFCNRLSFADGFTELYSYEGNSVICDFSKQGYRLPTEAEWEYVAENCQGITVYTPDIMEWCWDWFAPYKGGEQHNPIGPVTGKYKAIRRKKTSALNDEGIESKKRYNFWPNNSVNKTLSFRIVCRI